MFILNNTLLHLCKNFLPSITIIIMVSKQIHLYTVYKYSNIYRLCKQYKTPFLGKVLVSFGLLGHYANMKCGYTV